MPRRGALPEGLRRDVDGHALPAVTCCGTPWLEARDALVREQRDYVPAEVRIRRIELGPCLVADFGDGYLCRDPVCLPAGEPAGVAVAADGRILLVDTNNHRILVYDENERSYGGWAG